MRKKVLILGATINQLPFVLTAKDRGIETISLDNIPTSICHRYTDYQVNISTGDTEAVLQYVKQHPVDGIVTCASDLALPTGAYVCRKLGLPSVSYESVLKTVNKQKFRAFQKKHGFTIPRCYSCSSVENAIRRLTSLTGTWVIKPVDSSGSKGISLVDLTKQNDYQSLVATAFSFSRTQQVLIEEFIQGSHCSVDGFINESEIEQLYITNKTLTPLPHLTPIAHSLPSILPVTVQKSIRAEITKMLRLLEIKTSPFDFDILVTDSGQIVIIEMSLRLGGNGIPGLIKYATGNDLYDAVISSALSEPIPRPIRAKQSLFAGIYLIRANQRGSLISITEPETLIEKYPTVLKEIVYDVKAGDSVEPFTQGNHRLGHFVIQAPTMEELHSLARTITRDIRITIDATPSL